MKPAAGPAAGRGESRATPTVAAASASRCSTESFYNRLLSHFDSVGVSRRGQARVATVAPGLYGEGLKVTVAQVGEQYHVCCRWCDDVHQSLSINHLYGQRDDYGRRLTFLAYCHRANCLRLPRNRAALAALLQANDGILDWARIRPGRMP